MIGLITSILNRSNKIYSYVISIERVKYSYDNVVDEVNTMETIEQILTNLKMDKEHYNHGTTQQQYMQEEQRI
jgi:hypothetical protein